MGFPEERLMRMLTIPLFMINVITGIAELSLNTSRKIAVRGRLYIVLTTFMAVSIGIIVVLTIRPGGDAHDVTGYNSKGDRGFSALDAALDLFRNMVPKDLLQYKAKVMEFEVLISSSNFTTNSTKAELKGPFVDEVNILGLIVFSFMFGLGLNKVGKRAKIVVEVLSTISEMAKCGVKLIDWLLPVGVLFMTAEHVVEVGDWQTIPKLGKFMGAVIIRLIIHGAVVLPLIYLVCVRRNPLSVIRGAFPALLNAALLSSSSAVFPHTYYCCVERLKIDRRITRLMLPIGTSINMGGTVLYKTIAAVFITQLSGIQLKPTQFVTIGLMVAVASVEAAGSPATRAFVTLSVLTAVGLPVRDAFILVGVEWLLEHFNTVVNVLGNCIGICLVHHASSKELQEIDLQEQERGRMGGPGAVEQEEDSFSTSEDSIHNSTSYL